MENRMGNVADLELVDRIILNGKIGYINTDDENDSTIGIQDIIRKVTFNGELLVERDSGFPLTREMANRIGWGDNYASVRFVTSDNLIDPTTIEDKLIESYYGDVDAKYSLHCSDVSGYLWTEEDFKVGGHDIPSILSAYMDKYIHMEIELFEEKTK